MYSVQEVTLVSKKNCRKTNKHSYTLFIHSITPKERQTISTTTLEHCLNASRQTKAKNIHIPIYKYYCKKTKTNYHKIKD